MMVGQLAVVEGKTDGFLKCVILAVALTQHGTVFQCCWKTKVYSGQRDDQWLPFCAGNTAAALHESIHLRRELARRSQCSRG